MKDILNDVFEMSDLQVLKELNLELSPSNAREYNLNMGLLRDKLIKQRLSKLDKDEVFEGEAEALNKLYKDVGLPVEDSEPTDDQSLDEILEKDVEDISKEEILKIADYLDKQANWWLAEMLWKHPNYLGCYWCKCNAYENLYISLEGNYYV